MGVYAAAKFSYDSLDKLQNYFKVLGLKNPVARDEIHTTIMYSEQNTVEWYKTKHFAPVEIKPPFVPKLFNTTLVLAFESDFCQSRFQYAMSLGCSYFYPSYLPHLTLSYQSNMEEYERAVNMPFTESLYIAYEYAEALQKDWHGT